VPLDLRCPRAEAAPSGGCECTPRIEGPTSAKRPINTGDVHPCGNTAGGPLRTRQPAKPSKHGGFVRFLLRAENVSARYDYQSAYAELQYTIGALR